VKVRYQPSQHCDTLQPCSLNHLESIRNADGDLHQTAVNLCSMAARMLEPIVVEYQDKVASSHWPTALMTMSLNNIARISYEHQLDYDF